MKFKINPKLDLVLERTVDVPRELLWKGWTESEHLKKWFCPKPWQVSEAELDVRPGGIFRTVMRSPEGQEFPSVGCFLEVVKNEKLIFTSILHPDFRPAPVAEGGHDLPFTGVILLESVGSQTKYTAIALHRDETGKKAHEQMGFTEGWGAAFDQLVELIKSKEMT